MNSPSSPNARLTALPIDHVPELKESLQTYVKTLGFVPNSVLIMQRKPKLVQALAQLAAAVWDPQSEVPLGFKRLVAHVASKAHGCQY